MTTKRSYLCNCCKNELTEDNPGFGFAFKSGNTEFQHTTLQKAENHLCQKCISAICDMAGRIRSD